MIHLITYNLRIKLRNFSMVFWPLVFPLILGTFFFFAFGSPIPGLHCPTSDVDIKQKLYFDIIYHGNVFFSIKLVFVQINYNHFIRI